MLPQLWFALSGSLPSSATLARQIATSNAPAAEVVGPTYRFGDFDGDGLEDVYFVDPLGTDKLFKNLGGGAFEDVTAARGLDGVSGSRMALWLDFDGDRVLDLYVSNASGRSRLFQNTGAGMFVDVSEVAGVRHPGAELFAESLDFDFDLLLDLHVVTELGDVLYHNVGHGTFERAGLPQLSRGGVSVVPPPPGELTVANTVDAAGGIDEASRTRVLSQHANSSGTSGVSGLDELDESSMPGPLAVGNRCPQQIKDAATGNCLSASTTPTLGLLYPLSTNLNVSAAGNVGIGTTSPSAKLHVAGVDGLLATGTSGSGSIPATGGGVRMMWYPRKAAFRVGSASGAVWDDANVGDGSVAMNVGTQASGADSTAMGLFTFATGTASTSMGNFTTASGQASTALNYFTTASGLSSTAMGEQTIAAAHDAVALGRYNVGGGNPNSWIATDPLFEVGIGASSSTRANALTVLKSGNLGVGTATPGAKLDVAGSANITGDATVAGNVVVDSTAANTGTNANVLALGGVGSGAAIGSKRSAGGNQNGLDFYTGAISRMAITQGGNVGIGTSSPGEKLGVAGGVNVDSNAANTGSVANGITFGSTGSGEAIGSKRNATGNQFGLDFYTNGVNRLVIANNGNVGINTTSPAMLFHVNGSAGKPGGGTWTTVSDVRLKHNVHTLDHALDTLLALRGVNFEYNDPDALDELPGVRVGFIAQEVEKVLPDWVEEGADGYKRMTVRGFEALAVEGLRELANKNDELARENEALRERVAHLESLANDVAALKAEMAKLAGSR